MRPTSRLLLTAAATVALTPAAPSSAQPIAPPRILTDVPAVLADAPAGPEAEEHRTTQLGVPRPETFAPATPERAAAEFLTGWHDRAWDRMALWSTGGPAALRAVHAVDRLRGWTFTDRRAGDGVAFVDALTARRGMRPQLQRRPMTLVLARDTGGRWRVVHPGANGSDGRAS